MVGLLDETITDKNQRKQEEADNLPGHISKVTIS